MPIPKTSTGKIALACVGVFGTLYLIASNGGQTWPYALAVAVALPAFYYAYRGRE